MKTSDCCMQCGIDLGRILKEDEYVCEECRQFNLSLDKLLGPALAELSRNPEAKVSIQLSNAQKAYFEAQEKRIQS